MLLNFYARLFDSRGRTVPGSERHGHNVFTDKGRETLTQLMCWDTIEPDVPHTDHRVRWAGVGAGLQPEITSVVALVSPLQVDGGGDYLKVLDHSLSSFPIKTTLRHVLTFDTTELSHAGDVIVSEAGLFLDSSPGLTLDPAVGTNNPAFYKTFDGIVKTPAFSLEIIWEHKF